MSIANFDSEREARSWYNKHLLSCHGFSTTSFGHLTTEQLASLHRAFHLDGWAFPPHVHSADDVTQIENEFDSDYLAEMVKSIQLLEAKQA